jgi:hypothetical protein
VNVKKITNIEYYTKYEEIYNPYKENRYVNSIFDLSNSEKIYQKVNNKKIFDSESLYLLIEFERKNYKLNSYVEIGYDYPIHPPKFLLSFENIKNYNLSIPNELLEYVNKENNLDDFKIKDCRFSNVSRVIIIKNFFNILN